MIRLFRRNPFSTLLLVIALGVAAQQAWSSRSATVYVLNGLHKSVEVRLGGKSVQVPPKERRAVSIATGTRHVEVIAGGQAVASEDVVVPSDHAFVGYNVLGAAPLYRAHVRYSKSPRKDSKPDIVLLPGTLVAVEHASYLFEDPPKTMSVSKGSSGTSVTVVDVLRGGDWETSLQALLYFDLSARAAQLARQVLPVEPDALNGLRHASAKAFGPEETLVALREVLAGQPDSFEAHRLYQHELRRLEGTAAVLGEYQALASSQRPPRGVQQLLSRVEPAPAAEQRMRALLAREPSNADALRRLAAALARQERWAEAAEALARAPQDAEAQNWGDLEAEIQAQLGQHQRALDALSKIPPAELRSADLAMLAGLTARLHGEDKGGKLIDARESEPQGRALLRALAGLPVDYDKIAGDSPVAQAARIALLAVDDAARAFPFAQNAEDRVLLHLPQETLLLLAAPTSTASGPRPWPRSCGA
jgi:hypothetical protein